MHTKALTAPSVGTHVVSIAPTSSAGRPRRVILLKRSMRSAPLNEMSSERNGTASDRTVRASRPFATVAAPCSPLSAALELTPEPQAISPSEAPVSERALASRVVPEPVSLDPPSPPPPTSRNRTSGEEFSATLSSRLTQQDADALLHAVITCLQSGVRGSAAGRAVSALCPETGESIETLLDIVLGTSRYRLVRSQRSETGNGNTVLSDGNEATFGEALSPREREIARMVARGYPNKTIAAVLEISPFTVNTYLRRVFAKLGVPSRAAMVNVLHQGK